MPHLERRFYHIPNILNLFLSCVQDISIVDAKIFHICYPVTYADGEEEMFKWSFICPNGTIFDQVYTHQFILVGNSN